MRWYIAENKRKIETEDMSEHFGDIDMSGEKVLGIIHYGRERRKNRDRDRLGFSRLSAFSRITLMEVIL